jgi:hypothetical protein
MFSFLPLLFLFEEFPEEKEIKKELNIINTNISGKIKNRKPYFLPEYEQVSGIAHILSPSCEKSCPLWIVRSFFASGDGGHITSCCISPLSGVYSFLIFFFIMCAYKRNILRKKSSFLMYSFIQWKNKNI